MQENEGLSMLTHMFKDKDWFCETGVDNIGRYIVYVKYMNMETMTLIPQQILDKQVLVHLFASKVASATDFTNDGNHKPFSKPVLELVEEDDSDLLENDLDDLIPELDRLKGVCGSNVLEAIFYEEHDGKNAITNLSELYPEVRENMSKLYNEYGFDIIYDLLEKK